MIEFQKWQLEPVPPKTITGKKIIAPIVGTVEGVILAPLLVKAAVPMIGFTAAGIKSGSLAAGMMSAEAISSGGGVAAGGLVALLQSVGAVGLGVLGTSNVAGGGAIIGGTMVGLTAIGSGMFRFDVKAT